MRASLVIALLVLAAAPDLLIGGSAAATGPAVRPIPVLAPVRAGAQAERPATDRVSVAAPTTTPTGYGWPVVPPVRVLRGFDPPATRYGPGHLGVDLAAGLGTPVRAAGAGVVRFAGPVAGRGVVVVAHPDGVTTEYEPLAPAVRVGTVVTRVSVLGVVSRPRHRGCDRSCVHWGARRDGRYFDPRLLLGDLGPVRLLPWSRRSAG